MPASQLALLLGPETCFRDGAAIPCQVVTAVRPIVVCAGSDLPEGVTCTPHEGSSQPPDTGHQPENWATCFDVLLLWLPASGATRHRDGSFFLCIVTGASVCCGRCTSSLSTLRCHFLRACRGSRILRPCRCGDFGFVSRHKPAEHGIPDVSATTDVEASSITSCCGRRVLLSERRCGVTVCLQSRRKNPLSISLRSLPRE